MHRIKNYLFSYILVLGICNIYPQSPDFYVHQFMNDGNVPGVFVAVVKLDSILFQKGFGLADVSKHLPITAKTCMELGSISKVFTDETIWYLHQHGILDIDDPITEYLPDAPSAWSSITIRHLMDHTSGIQNYLLDPRFGAAGIFNYSPSNPNARFFLDSITTDSMLHMFYTLPLEFKPNATWSYSNTGYYLLGIIAERASGKPFFDLVNEVFLTPLNMLETKAGELAAADRCLSPGYISTSDSLRNAPVLSSRYAFSAGAWATTGEDIIKYMIAVHTRRLPSDKSGNDWRSHPPSLNMPFTYHMARFYSIFHNKHVYSHNGGTPGFSSSLIYINEDSISIIVLANRQDYAPIDLLAWNILSMYVPSLKYKNNSLHGKDELKFSRLVMEFVRAIQKDVELPEGLSKPLDLFLDSENGRGMWKWVFEKGYPTTINCVEKEILDSASAYRFELTAGADIMYRVTAVINQEGEVAQLLWW